MVGDAVVCGLKLAELAQSVELKEYGSVATAVKPFRLTQQKALHKQCRKAKEMLNVKLGWGLVLRDSVLRYRAFLLVFAVVYTLCFCAAMPAYIDEAYTYNLATDSLAHLFSALKDGADGAFPAYALFAYGWEKLFGSSEFSLRLTSGLFVILFVWHQGGHLMRRFRPAAAVVGLLVVLANETFILYTIQARFYGLVILLFSIVFWSTWDMTQARTISGRHRLWHGAACGLLCLSHPLGIVYAAILALLYSGFSYVRNTFTFSSAASFLGGPLLLLTWLPSFLDQRMVKPVFQPGQTVPGWSKYWEYAFLDSGGLFIIVLIGAGVLAVSTQLWKIRRGNASTAAEAGPPAGETTRADNALLVVYAGAFVAVLNVTFALLDAAHVIPVYLMSAVRYVLVAAVAYVVIVAMVWEGLEGLIQRAYEPQMARAVGRIVWGLVLVGQLAGMASAWNGWRMEKATMEATMARLSRLAREKHLGIVCEEHVAAFFLATRAGATDVKYVLADSFPFKTLMRRIEKHYPHPTPVTMTEFRQFTNDFVLLPAGRAPVVVHRPGTSAR